MLQVSLLPFGLYAPACVDPALARRGVAPLRLHTHGSMSWLFWPRPPSPPHATGSCACHEKSLKPAAGAADYPKPELVNPKIKSEFTPKKGTQTKRNQNQTHTHTHP